MKTSITTMFSGFLATVLSLFCPTCCADKDGLAIETSAVGKTYLTYKEEPLFAFGPGDEMRLLNGAADVERWIDWQRANGMNLVRAYPMSVPLDAYGAPGIAPFLKHSDKWDVDALNEEYFEHIGDVAKTLEKKGIILHLQLWQIVFFKGGEKRWDINFLNPKNNVNAWTQAFSRGSQYINAPADSVARQHQQRWVYAILDAMKGRGNVIIDVINELGNEMGTLEWAVTVADWIHDWVHGGRGFGTPLQPGTVRRLSRPLRYRHPQRTAQLRKWPQRGFHLQYAHRQRTLQRRHQPVRRLHVRPCRPDRPRTPDPVSHVVLSQSLCWFAIGGRVLEI